MADQEIEQTLAELQKAYHASLEAKALLEKSLEDSSEAFKKERESRESEAEQAIQVLDELAVVKAENEALKKRVAELEGVAAKYENPTFEYNGAIYEILVKQINVPSVGVVSAADIQASSDIQARLVSRNSGNIRKKI